MIVLPLGCEALVWAVGLGCDMSKYNGNKAYKLVNISRNPKFEN
jgi:hypothetical protein